MSDMLEIVHDIEKEVIDINYLMHLINTDKTLLFNDSDNHTLTLSREELKAIINVRVNNQLGDLLQELNFTISDIINGINKKDIAEIEFYAKEKVLDEFARASGLAMSKEQNIYFKNNISTELICIIKKYDPKDREENKEKKRAMDAISKNDRVLSAPNVKFLSDHCEIPYKMNVKNGVYILESTVDDDGVMI